MRMQVTLPHLWKPSLKLECVLRYTTSIIRHANESACNPNPFVLLCEIQGATARNTEILTLRQ